MSNIVISTNTQVIYEGETAYILTYAGFQNTTPNNNPQINSIYVGITANNVNYIGNTPSSNVVSILETIEEAAYVNATSLTANLANYVTFEYLEHPSNEDLDSGSF